MIIPIFIPHAGCPHQCVFCDQKRITGNEQPPAPTTLPETIRSFLQSGNNDQSPEVAFFGGTFTALPRDLQLDYLQAVTPFIRAGTISNIRISTRPDGITETSLALLREHHVTIVELGVQSFDDEVLRRSGRGHRADDTAAAANLLRDCGFSVGFQLMPGLPGDTMDRFRFTISRTLDLKPDFVRLYPALVIKGTALEKMFLAGHYAPLSLEQALSWCKEAIRDLRRASIPVIRAGLQSTGELKAAGTIVAGPYHPAFRQKVDSALLLEAMELALEAVRDQGSAVLRVNPRDLSTAVGEKRCNIRELKQRLGFEQIRFLPDPLIERGTVLAR